MEPETSKMCYQKRMGPAPFASFEDLSDEMDSPGEKEIAIIRLPGITEQDVSTSLDIDSRNNKHPGVSLIGTTLKNSHSSSPSSLSHSPVPNKMKLANTPRIDISRASSSSHHDSRDSTPEREMFEGGDANTVKTGLGFKEDDALELRLSTEELDFQDTADTKTHKYKHRSASPEFEELYINNNRKDSQCSDVILLSISGRTSRLSSIGSQGSAQSRLSNASHISVTSGHSAYSQCSSPHKTLLETSFCGYRGSQSNLTENADHSKDLSEDFEKVFLSRKSNPAEAVLLEGLSRKKHSDGEKRAKPSCSESVKGEKEDRPKLPRRIVSKSGVEYIYIPLKGPLPPDDSEDKVQQVKSSSKGEYREQPRHKKKSASREPGQKTPRPQPSAFDKLQVHNQEPKYIRIRLKPEHCYDDYDGASTSSVTKPVSLNLSLHKENGTTTKVYGDNNFNSIQQHARSLTNSPKLLRREVGGSSPSPSVPRRNSFVTLFRTGPDSPSTSKQKRKNTFTGCINSSSHSRSASRSSEHTKGTVSSTESVDSKGKPKSVLSLFKFPKDNKPKSSDSVPQKCRSAEHTQQSRIKQQEKRERPLTSESIRIPLHSPTYYESKSILQELQTSSQDSQVTVVEVAPQSKPTVAPITEEYKQTKIESTIKCDIIEVISTTKEDAIEKVEVLDTRLQVEDNDEKIIMVDVETNNNTTITTTADVEVTMESPKDISEGKEMLPTSDSLSECSKAVATSTIYDDHNSSESERDIELLEYRKCDKSLLASEGSEIERKAIVFQQDSFEDELPYVPTTLPQERSTAIPILPIKQRCGLEMKTCPIERPRSTTPIHSSGLDNYFDGFAIKSDAAISEKLKISLPRSEVMVKQKSQQAETTVSNSADYKKSKEKEETPPPLPPKGIQKSWINFEEVPERRKPPKRIQTIPSRGQIDISGLVKDNVVYTYVNPEECKCECHEHKEPETKPEVAPPQIQEDEIPLLTQDEKGANSDR